MISNRINKGFIYFDGLNTFVLCYGDRYVEDGILKINLMGIKECTIKDFNSEELTKIDHFLQTVATNIPPNNSLFRYLKTLFPLTPVYGNENLSSYYCNFLGQVLSGKLGLSHSVSIALDDTIKLSRQDEKIIYTPTLICATYFCAFANSSTYFDQPVQ